MPVSAPDRRDVRSRLYLLSFLDEFGPLYALYTLWFADHGVDAATLTVVFVLWAVMQSLLEVPTGALADRWDRRRLVALAQGLRAIGIGVWLVDPSVRGLFVGAVLWALHTALASGAWEALVHDELAAVGIADRYATVNARCNQFSNLGILSSAAVAAALAAQDVDLRVAGWTTVALHVPAVLAVLSLPDVRHVIEAAAATEEDTPDSWAATMRRGLGVARHRPGVARLLVVGALVEGFFILDEYGPLLVRDRGGSDAMAAGMVALIFGGLLLGGELAARRPDLGARPAGAVLVVGMATAGAGLAWSEPWGVAGLAVGYAALELVWVLSDASLQATVPATTRATVTSVRALGGGVCNAVAFALVGLLASGTDAAPGLLVGCAVLVAVGGSLVHAGRWIARAE